MILLPRYILETITSPISFSFSFRKAKSVAIVWCVSPKVSFVSVLFLPLDFVYFFYTRILKVY